jgi:hypothetical protein
VEEKFVLKSINLLIIINQYSDRPERLQMHDVVLGIIKRLLEMFENCSVVELNCACPFG